MLLDPIPVLLDIRCIDHQHIGLVLFETIDQQIVHDAPLVVGQTTVLHLAGMQLGRIIAGNPLYQVEGIGPL